jgi:hypothetical protein
MAEKTKEAKIVVFKIGFGRGTDVTDLIFSREDAEGVLGELFSGGWHIAASQHARDESEEDCIVLILQRDIDK